MAYLQLKEDCLCTNDFVTTVNHVRISSGVPTLVDILDRVEIAFDGRRTHSNLVVTYGPVVVL